MGFMVGDHYSQATQYPYPSGRRGPRGILRCKMGYWCGLRLATEAVCTGEYVGLTAGQWESPYEINVHVVNAYHGFEGLS